MYKLSDGDMRIIIVKVDIGVSICIDNLYDILFYFDSNHINQT